ALHRLGHVSDLVAADKGGAEVEGIRTLLHLLTRHLDAAVPIASLLPLAELLRAVGVAALANREVSVFLAQRDRLVERGKRWHPISLPLGGRPGLAGDPPPPPPPHHAPH